MTSLNATAAALRDEIRCRLAFSAQHRAEKYYFLKFSEIEKILTSEPFVQKIDHM